MTLTRQYVHFLVMSFLRLSFIFDSTQYFTMSDIIGDLKRVENSLYSISSDVENIAKEYPDAKSKL